MIGFYKWLFESTEHPSEEEMFEFLLGRIEPQHITDETLPVIRDAVKLGRIFRDIDQDVVEDNIFDLVVYSPAYKIINKYYDLADRQKSALLAICQIRLGEHYPFYRKGFERMSKLGLASGVPSDLRIHLEYPRRNY